MTKSLKIVKKMRKVLIIAVVAAMVFTQIESMKIGKRANKRAGEAIKEIGSGLKSRLGSLGGSEVRHGFNSDIDNGNGRLLKSRKSAGKNTRSFLVETAEGRLLRRKWFRRGGRKNRGGSTQEVQQDAPAPAPAVESTESSTETTESTEGGRLLRRKWFRRGGRKNRGGVQEVQQEAPAPVTETQHETHVEQSTESTEGGRLLKRRWFRRGNRVQIEVPPVEAVESVEEAY